MVCSVARSFPGGALSPCPNGYAGLAGAKGGCGLAPAVAPPPLPAQQHHEQFAVPHGLPPIATRVGQKKPPAAAGAAAPTPAGAPTPTPTPTRMPALKIRTPRRHFGMEEEES